MRRAAIVFAVIFGGALLLVEYLNFSGFCYPQRRYLSSDDLIASAVKDSMRRHAPVPNSPSQIGYASLEDFNRQNHNCCDINRWSTSGLAGPVWGRTLGYYEALVSITFRTAEGDGADNFYTSMTAVDSCGGVHRSYGFPSSGKASASGPFETSRDVRYSVAIGGKSDIAGIAQVGRE